MTRQKDYEMPLFGGIPEPSRAPWFDVVDVDGYLLTPSQQGANVAAEVAANFGGHAIIRALHSYRVVVAHGDYDDAGRRELVGVKASGPIDACRRAIHVTGAPRAVCVYRQDGTTKRVRR